MNTETRTHFELLKAAQKAYLDAIDESHRLQVALRTANTLQHKRRTEMEALDSLASSFL